MRPFGPEPVRPDRSMPLSAAIRRASGLALTRPPLSDAPASAGRPWSSACVTVRSTGFASLPVLLGSAGLGLASDSLAAGCGVSLFVGADTEAASSPSSARIAITAPTFTPSVPSAIRILAIVPSSTASNSIVALSVSISAMMSPLLTVSPSLTSHLASVPSSIVGDSAGILISIDMQVLLPGERIAPSRRKAGGSTLARASSTRHVTEKGSSHADLPGRDRR